MVRSLDGYKRQDRRIPKATDRLGRDHPSAFPERSPIETKLPESLFSDERGLYLKLYYFHRSIGYILIDPVDNLRLHDLHRIPSEEVIRDEKRFYQQHDARVEDTGIHDLARRPDAVSYTHLKLEIIVYSKMFH